MNGIYSAGTLAKIQNLRKLFQKVAIWIFIGGVALGVILIIGFGGEAWDMIGKTISTILLLAMALAISSNNFRRIEGRQKIEQIFATASLVANIVWTPLLILSIWEVFSFYIVNDNMSILGCLTAIAIYTAFFGFLSSNIMNINEYDRQKAIHPLKTTAVACLGYIFLYNTITSIMSITGSDKLLDERFSYLQVFAGVVWIVATVVALIFSRNAKKSMTVQSNSKKTAEKTSPDSEEEMRAEIEKRVRAEMMEKEIRKKVEAEYKEKQSNKK